MEPNFVKCGEMPDVVDADIQGDCSAGSMHDDEECAECGNEDGGGEDAKLGDEDCSGEDANSPCDLRPGNHPDDNLGLSELVGSPGEIARLCEVPG